MRGKYPSKLGSKLARMEVGGVRQTLALPSLTDDLGSDNIRMLLLTVPQTFDFPNPLLEPAVCLGLLASFVLQQECCTN